MIEAYSRSPTNGGLGAARRKRWAAGNRASNEVSRVYDETPDDRPARLLAWACYTASSAVWEAADKFRSSLAPPAGELGSFGGGGDMLIPIPIGTKHIAAVQGAVWKFVSCAHCQQGYAFLLELEATGEDHDLLFLDGEGSAERARAKAEENLLRKGRTLVVPVPCPNCGCYQDDMARMLKDEASINSLQIAGVVIVLLSLVPLALGIPYIWGLTIVLGVMGLAVLAWGYVLAFRFDANAGDPEPRKALGRGHAVWGEQLAELLATSPSAEPGAAPDRCGR